MAKRKPKTISKIVEEAARLMQKYVRLKASDKDGNVKCVTCGKVGHYKEMQGGHFIGRKWLATRLMEENIHPQCPCCNGPLSGNMIQYTLYMQDTYGRDFVEELQRLKHKSRKYYKPEVEEIKKELRQKIQELEQVM